jgi:hypothetical protein
MGMPINWGRRFLHMDKGQRPPLRNWMDTQMNEAYIRQLSKRTIDGKEDRAREGYHNGNVPFGYLPPEYPKPHDGAPSTWRPPRTPARPNPVTFPALVRIGELTTQGWTDRAIPMS